LREPKPKEKPADKDEPDTNWPETLEKAVLCGPQLGQVVLPPREKIIKDWFNEGDCGFIFAPRRMGKTWMNLGLSLAICTKGEFGPYQSEVAWPVLYIDVARNCERQIRKMLSSSGTRSVRAK